MIALITGAAKRLGRAMALDAAKQGYDVAVHYASSADAAHATVADIRALGQQAVALHADLLDEDETHALLPAAAASDADATPTARQATASAARPSLIPPDMTIACDGIPRQRRQQKVV